MTEKLTFDAYSLLKLTGFKLEEEVNDHIKDQINSKIVIDGANVAGKYYTGVVKLLQNSMGTLFFHLNVPSKQDVSSIAQLMIQVEEKVDRVEDQMIQLTQTVEGLKDSIKNDQ